MPVTFAFVIRQRPSLATVSGLPAPRGLEGLGTVSLAGGVHLEDGVYRIRMSDGREFRVNKVLNQWHIVGDG